MGGWAAVIYGAASIAAGLWQQQEAKKAADKQADLAEKIARQNAKAIRMENMEVARRHLLKVRDTLGTTKAMAGATGLTGLSHQRYMERLKNNALREAQWIRKSSVLQQEKEVREGISLASQARERGRIQQIQATSQIIQGAGYVMQGIDNWITQ